MPRERVGRRARCVRGRAGGLQGPRQRQGGRPQGSLGSRGKCGGAPRAASAAAGGNRGAAGSGMAPATGARAAAAAGAAGAGGRPTIQRSGGRPVYSPGVCVCVCVCVCVNCASLPIGKYYRYILRSKTLPSGGGQVSVRRKTHTHTLFGGSSLAWALISSSAWLQQGGLCPTGLPPHTDCCCN